MTRYRVFVVELLLFCLLSFIHCFYLASGILIIWTFFSSRGTFVQWTKDLYPDSHRQVTFINQINCVDNKMLESDWFLNSPYLLLNLEPELSDLTRPIRSCL